MSCCIATNPFYQWNQVISILARNRNSIKLKGAHHLTIQTMVKALDTTSSGCWSSLLKAMQEESDLAQ
eukprot:14494140-Ditylum_brightwellii.AAC.1